MNKTPKDKEQMTMIRLSQETREKLKYVGKKGETYDQIISRLFYEHLADDQGQNNVRV
jgi:predicted DNA-binding protein